MTALKFIASKIDPAFLPVLIATGLLNLAIALTAVPMFSYLAAAGPFYLWIWPIGLVLVGLAARGQRANETRGSGVVP